MSEFLSRIQFASPWVLGFLALPLLMGAWRLWRYRYLYPSLTLPALAAIQGHDRPIRGYLKQFLFVLRLLGVSALIIALARPQLAFNEENIDAEGIDIVLALDISESMNALDFKPDRLGAAKEKALQFVENRPNDRMGLVVFEGESFTQCPLTTDHDMLKTLLSEVRGGLMEGGTAIGMGLSTSVIRLKDSDAESKVIILLTDGVNNSGFVDPYTAIEAAKQYGIRVYTIGVGKNGMAPMRRQNAFGQMQIVQAQVELDEKLLQNIAKETGGKYFQATNNEALGNVYSEIDELEKTKIQVTRVTRKTEEFYPFLLIGGILLLLEMVLRYAVVRYIP